MAEGRINLSDLGGGGTARREDEGGVWLGEWGRNGGIRSGVSPTYASNLPLGWSQKKQQQAFDRMSNAYGVPVGLDDFLGEWDAAVKLAARSWEATNGGKTGTPLSVWDVIDLRARSAGGSGGRGGGGGGGRPRTITQTSRTINEITEGGAWALMTDAARQALGRAPTDEEVRAFAQRANQIASANPQITKSTMTQNADGSSQTTNTTVQPGATGDDFALEAKKMTDTPEAGAYQASTTYFDALMRGIGSVV
ncbi:hypothetical protein HMPREF0063_11495 [Aeromicrobium marinum DSM 15272]|uniref:Uncharacterized protein n=1 Tax=Aeromicrobium marinum DSM 15272 TaxID=585531 RepID=E2SBT6_9ACTN|nr:hypothetical protein HMPREF0063_11495 [Aeromicrobium marinum DSM 15272]